MFDFLEKISKKIFSKKPEFLTIVNQKYVLLHVLLLVPQISGDQVLRQQINN